ncbi:peptidase M20 [Anaerobacillus arseniciselenatis]|uniref:Peptidase M20 n=1 Tax=Anaerobacillus arseniciselenatis TaxID=85682 RepID=A0A1S2LVP2_9BACI|nr:M20 family metallopeptidase [Anaerobacillus arseniciselenatis]OIJ16270.1 peptidase M20 [Anaerobacillus arseniciselenatis]
MLDIVSRSELIKQDLIGWRRHLHSQPELSFKEEKTSAYIKEQLLKMGINDLQTDIAGHGIVATLRGMEGPVIGLRSDIDALPIEEKTSATYASQNKGVMHACGHDAHTAMLLGAAKLLKEEQKAGKLRGTVKFIFQPAEENTDEHGLTGAPYLLRSGAIEDVSKALALHVCPWRKTGEIQVHSGPSMANIDNFSLTIKGTGGHGGYPHQGKDPIWLVSFVLQGIYSLISRKVNPLDVGTISVGEIHGGKAANVIPNSVKLSGTMRSYTKEVRSQLIRELHTVASMVETLGGEYELEIEHGEPALYNDPNLTEVIKQSAKSLYKNIAIYEDPFGMGGEDFGHIAEKIPSSMFFLGCGFEGENERKLHTDNFEIDEEALPIGVAIFVDCVRRMLIL